MGYDLHITRAEDWCDDEGPPITADEWHDYVAADPELTPDPRNGPHMALWSGPSVHVEPWLNWSEPGQIYTKYPDRALVAKMLRIAEHFGARVQGDDGEVYTDPAQVPDDDSEVFSGSGQAPAENHPARPRPSWWRRLFGPALSV